MNLLRTLAAVAVLCAMTLTAVRAQSQCADETSKPGVVERLTNVLRDVQAKGLQPTLIETASKASLAAVNLSVRDALDLEQLLYRSLRYDGQEPSPLLKSLLAEDPIDSKIGEGAGLPFLVDLDVLGRDPAGQERIEALERTFIAALKRKVEEAYRASGLVPDDHWDAPPEIPEKYHPTWARVVKQFNEREPALLDLEMDGDPSTQTPLELMGLQVLRSALPYRSRFQEVKADVDYKHAIFDPWLQKRRPGLARIVSQAKAKLRPEWFDPNWKEQLVRWEGGRVRIRLGSHADPARAQEVKAALDAIQSDHDFADAVYALALEPVTALQSFWHRLLLDLPEDDRHALLIRTAAIAMRLTVRADARVEELKAPPRLNLMPSYDRGAALRGLLLRTSYDLDFVARDELAKALPLSADTLLAPLRNSEVRFDGLDAGDLPREPVMISEFYSVGDRQITPAMLRAPGARRNRGAGMRMSVVMEGGGGKGTAYAGLLRELGKSVRAGEIRPDQWVGASVGALNAGLAAAGYTPEELAALPDVVDFTEFFADHVALLGGAQDPHVRGFNRTGLFSTRLMYQRIDQLLRAKLGIRGRPIFFKDLPNDLRVVSQVAAGTVPPELYKKLNVGRDGLVVFSKENTPYAEVAMAMTASAAIPSFFNAPRVHVVTRTRLGVTQTQLALSDGGGLKNLPADEATNEKALMIVLPAYVETEDGTRLTTLNFGPTSDTVATVDAFNARMNGPTLRRMPKFLRAAQRAGYERVVTVLDLTDPATRPTGKPVIQGRTRTQTRELHRLAAGVGLPHLGADRGAEVFEANLLQESTLLGYWAQYLLNHLLDGSPDMYEPDIWLWQDRKFTAPQRVSDVDELLRSVFFGLVVGIGERGDGAHLFEEP